ncbi:Caskin-1 [Exaiptasia diaphana]|nr:Caskin-1 [Exaiptasia diaphana]
MGSCRFEIVPSPLNSSSYVIAIAPNALGTECTDGFPADLSSLYLAGLVGIYFAAALVHPSEAFCLVHGIWYLFCLPSGYLLLIVYSLANITDRSWGTREAKNTFVDDKNWYKVFWKELRHLCFCCQPEQKPAPSRTEEFIVEQPGECRPRDGLISDSHGPSTSVSETAEDHQVLSSHNSDSESQMPIEKWLADFKDSYKNNFIDNGYDDVSFLIGMTDDDLRSIGIERSGDRSQILDEIKNIPFPPVDTDVPENLKEWLHKLGLGRYWTHFEKNGYKKPRMLERLKDMKVESLRKELKEDLNVLKLGHLNKMIKAITNMRYATSAQREIHQTRKIVDKVNPIEIDGKELRFWEMLRSRCLLPESAVFGSMTELKEKLEDLRDSFLTVFAIANVMWIIVIITLDKQAELKVKGTNAIGLVFLFVFGLVIVIQFLTMIFHRLSTLCHLLARALWKRGRSQLSWAFNDEDLRLHSKPQQSASLSKGGRGQSMSSFCQIQK